MAISPSKSGTLGHPAVRGFPEILCDFFYVPFLRDKKSMAMAMAMFKRKFARTIPINLRAPHMKMWGFEAKRARKFTRTSPRTLPLFFHYHAFFFPDFLLPIMLDGDVQRGRTGGHVKMEQSILFQKDSGRLWPSRRRKIQERSRRQGQLSSSHFPSRKVPEAWQG